MGKGSEEKDRLGMEKKKRGSEGPSLDPIGVRKEASALKKDYQNKEKNSDL